MSWLRFARKLPGLNKQPTYPDLEALVEAEAEKTGDEYHIARWVVPLVGVGAGVLVFLPLSIFVSPYFLFGLGGLSLIGAGIGYICHLIAKGVSPSLIALRKRTRVLRDRLINLKNILGFEPALSPAVGEMLNEAAHYYLQVCHDEAPAGMMWPEARQRALAAMEEAMTRMLELAEPPTVSAQDAILVRGWAKPLLNEMKELAKKLKEHEQTQRESPLIATDSDALAGLREARVELERLDQATQELDIRQHERS